MMDSAPPSGNASQATDDCTICLSSLASGTPLLILSCGHRFHFQCLTSNIQAGHNECPLCRGAIDAFVIKLLGNPCQLSTQTPQMSQPQVGQAPTNAGNAAPAAIVVPSIEDPIDEATAAAISERFLAARQVAVALLNEANNLPLITAVTTLEYEGQVSHEESNIYGLVTLQAPPVLQSNNLSIIQSRAPIDLVCVVDQSGSMSGEKITLLKKTLTDIVDQLGELDRLAIVSFNDGAFDRSHGLKRVNQQNRQILKTDIDGIVSGGNTYIGAGLEMGINLLLTRQTKNPLSALLILTDGQDSSAHDYTQIMSTLPEGAQCYTFGYGADHHAELLVKLAEQGNDGTFTYIDQEQAVSTAFAITMAGLLTCMAQKIEVNIELSGEYRITHFLSKYKYEPEQLPSMKLAVKLHNLSADEKRNLVFRLHIPKVNDDQNVEMSSQQSMAQDETTSEQQVFEKQPIGHVSVSYTDPNTAQLITTTPVSFYLIRAPNLPVELLRGNYQLDRQRNRIETIDALERAMAERNYEQSRSILSAQVEKIKVSASAQDPFCQELIQDLEHSFPSEQEYRATHHNVSRSHQTERGTYSTTATSSSRHYHSRLQRELTERYKRIPLRPGDGICALATWTQNATTVAGGNGQGSDLNQLDIPYGFFVDDNQSIYVADFNNHRVVKWDRGVSSGQIVAGGKGHGLDNDQLDSPMDVFVDKHGTMYISDRNNDRVQRWSRGAQSGETIIRDIFPIGIVQDDQGSLYVSDDIKHEVRKWHVGDTIGQLVTSEVFDPGLLFVDRNLALYVADKGNHRVIKVDDGTTQISIVAGGSQSDGADQLGYPDSVIVDELGTVYVTDTDHDRIVRWPRGATSGSVIAGGHGEGSQSDQLSSPTDLAFDLDGNLYVVDSKNFRVQKFAIAKNLC
ncbi:unnamed protein product [Rotaria sp. Silwood2]|nr:unnamed protein product [Rotaria sp. Silwood2]